MNAADNRLSSVKTWLLNSLRTIYSERESKSISELVIEACYGWGRAEQIMRSETRLSESEMLKIVPIKRRLMNHEPVQYVLGKAQFYGLELMVNESVLIPRPETEELVNHILQSHQEEKINLLDIGTGSGCIPLAVKSQRPNWNVEAYDVSESALATASANAEKLELEVKFSKVDILQAETSSISWDVIVSNPPYIPNADKAAMADQVLKFEPSLALFCPNDDALIFYRKIIEFAEKSLSRRAELWFEIHEEKAPEVMALFNFKTWEAPILYQDMQSKDRVVMSRLLKIES